MRTVTRIGRGGIVAMVGVLSLTLSACQGGSWADLIDSFNNSGAPADGVTSTTSTSTPDTVESTTSTTAAPAPEPEPSTTTTAAPAPTAPPAPDPVTSDQLSAEELEIFRLTNELRTDPTGSLGRSGGIPDCNGDGAPDQATPVPALQLDEAVSVSMSRDWANQMAATDKFEHRSGESAKSIYTQLGISWSSFGENIAWEGGYPVEQKVMVHFTGWVESDGHYCNMMSAGYTHLGVGYATEGNASWAVQNFYSAR